jgi:hypothetical protein
MSQDLSVVPLGVDATISRNTGSAFVTPTYSEIKPVKDVTLTSTRASADTTTRARRVKVSSTSILEIAITFNMVHVTADAGMAAIIAAHYANTPIDLLVLDKAVATVGAHGWHADWNVIECTRKEDLMGVVNYDVRLEPAYTANAPTETTIAS